MARCVLYDSLGEFNEMLDNVLAIVYHVDISKQISKQEIEMNNSMNDLFGDVIYAYTRKQAIDDGVQVLLDGDLGNLAKEAGISVPVYMTTSVWTLVQKAINSEKHMNDLNGVMWDIFTMFKYAAKRNSGSDTMNFQVIITGTGKTRNHWLTAQIGATDFDDASPAITISLYGED